MRVSVVVPVHRNGGDWLPRILARLREVEGLEVVCAGDAPPPEGTGARFVRVEDPSRGARLQAGIDASSCRTVLLHHPRSLLPAEGLRWLAEGAAGARWGGFTHAFDWDHPLLRFTSWYSNRVRLGLRGIVYLDHCVFFDRTLLVRPIPPVEIFEDTELSLILRESGPPALAPFVATTSAVRFRANGVWRQALLNQRMKLSYLLGASHRRMNARYERGLGLNA
ncbi:MAG: glycosyl transferase, family 2 [Elusimicrobiota bacterium]|nr:glycosyl transferase, family 2 [Elusimicrobiota bacterium]